MENQHTCIQSRFMQTVSAVCTCLPGQQYSGGRGKKRGI